MSYTVVYIHIEYYYYFILEKTIGNIANLNNLLTSHNLLYQNNMNAAMLRLKEKFIKIITNY